MVLVACGHGIILWAMRFYDVNKIQAISLLQDLAQLFVPQTRIHLVIFLVVDEA